MWFKIITELDSRRVKYWQKLIDHYPTLVKVYFRLVKSASEVFQDWLRLQDLIKDVPRPECHLIRMLTQHFDKTCKFIEPAFNVLQTRNLRLYFFRTVFLLHRCYLKANGKRLANKCNQISLTKPNTIKESLMKKGSTDLAFQKLLKNSALPIRSLTIFEPNFDVYRTNFAIFQTYF